MVLKVFLMQITRDKLNDLREMYKRQIRGLEEGPERGNGDKLKD